MVFKGRDSVRDGFTSLQILTVYSLYVLETIKYLKWFCLPSNVQEDQPYSMTQI